MKAEPNENGSITLTPDNAAESFFLRHFNEGTSQYYIWIGEDKKMLAGGYLPQITIFPAGITFEEFTKRNEN